MNFRKLSIYLTIAAFSLSPRAFAATADEYTSFMKAVMDSEYGGVRDYRLAKRSAEAKKAIGRGSIKSALCELMLARRLGEEARIEKAKYVLDAVNNAALLYTGEDRKQVKQSEFVMHQLVLIYTWLKDMDRLTEKDVERSERMITSQASLVKKLVGERGAMNRGALQGLACAEALRLFPNHDDAPIWKKYALACWNDWKSFDDTIEDSDHYNALWLLGVFSLAESLGKEDELKHPSVRKLIDRFFQYCSPIGISPDFGDSHWGSSVSMWIACFEKAGALYNDGRYRQQADDMFRYLVRNCDTDGKKLVPDVTRLAYAVLWMDEGIPLTKQARVSTVLERKGRWGNTHLDKIILRSGIDGQDSFVMANCIEQGYHGHQDAGSLTAFVHKGSVLLREMGRYTKVDSLHNSLVIRPVDEPFLLFGAPVKAGREYTTLIDVLKPNHHFGTEPNMDDIHSIVFRLGESLKDTSDKAVALKVSEFSGIRSDGTEETIFDMGNPREAVLWDGAKPGMLAKKPVTSMFLKCSDSDKIEKAFFTREVNPAPMDFTKYERLKVTWSVDHPEIEHDQGVSLRFLSKEGTQGFKLPRRLVYRKTVAAATQSTKDAEYSSMELDMFDSFGRPMKQQRELLLDNATGILLVFDSLKVIEPGEYAIGQVWHVQNVLEEDSEAGWFQCQDDYQFDYSRVDRPGSGHIYRSPARPLLIQMAGPKTATFHREHKKLVTKVHYVSQEQHLYSRYILKSEGKETRYFATALVPRSTGKKHNPGSLQVSIERDTVTVKSSAGILSLSPRSFTASTGDQYAKEK